MATAALPSTMHVDHVGVATADSDGLAGLYEELLDAPVVQRETFGDLAVVFLDCDNGYFELLEPTDESGTIARYLDARGSGLHHIALATDDLGAALSNAADLGVELIDEAPRPGAWGHDVAFLHPHSTGGVLVEFVETA